MRYNICMHIENQLIQPQWYRRYRQKRDTLKLKPRLKITKNEKKNNKINYIASNFFASFSGDDNKWAFDNIVQEVLCRIERVKNMMMWKFIVSKHGRIVRIKLYFVHSDNFFVVFLFLVHRLHHFLVYCLHWYQFGRYRFPVSLCIGEAMVYWQMRPFSISK